MKFCVSAEISQCREKITHMMPMQFFQMGILDATQIVVSDYGKKYYYFG